VLRLVWEFVIPNVEPSGNPRQNARSGLAKMCSVPPDRAWGPCRWCSA
jgi:hypothetical protein